MKQGIHPKWYPDAPVLVDDRWRIETMQYKTQELYDSLLREKGFR